MYFILFFFQFNDVITRNQAGCSFLHTSPDVVIQVATETKPDKLTNLICNINMQDTYSTDSLVTSLCISAHEKL